MYLLLISLYEFGQFLRIILWISVPLVVLSMLVTTWLHYRRKRQLPPELLLSLSGAESSGIGFNGAGANIPPANTVPPAVANGPVATAVLLESAAEISGTGQEPLEESAVDPVLDPEQKENIYKGILWMKEKYEQYRDMADRRYEQLKEQLTRTENKYQELLETASRPVPPAEMSPVTNDVEKASYPDLLEEKNRQIAFLQQQLDQRIKNFHQSELDSRENKSRMLELEELQLRTRHLLEEKQAYIDQLEGQLVSERRKIEDLVLKLQISSQQLLTIYEELDRSMKPADHPETGGALNSPTGS